MLNIGIVELVIIFCVAIVFLSPKDMVKALHTIKNFRAKVSNLYFNSKSYIKDLTDTVTDTEISKIWHKDLPQANEYLAKIFQHELLLKQKKNIDNLPKSESIDIEELDKNNSD